jgi:hypothetical protein
MILHFRLPRFRVLRISRRVAGWYIIARFEGRAYRRFWLESDAPSRQMLLADFKARPAAWFLCQRRGARSQDKSATPRH